LRRLTDEHFQYYADEQGDWGALSFVNYLTEFPYFRDEVLPRLARAGVRV